MDKGKDPLVSPSAEWLREYQSTVERRPRSSSSSGSASGSSSVHSIRRRHRRRITHQTKYARRRIVRMVLVSSAVFAIMAASIYYALSHTETRGEQGSRARVTGPRTT